MKNTSKNPSLLSGKNENLLMMFEGILQNSNNIFYEHDLEGHFKFISPQIKNILGYSPEDKKNTWRRMLTDNPINEIGIESTQKAIDTCERQPPYELELLTKDGGKKWVEVRETPMVVNGKTVTIVGATIDITERKNMIEQLRKSEENYRLLIENQNEIIAKFDLNGCLTYVSPNYCTNFNVQLVDIIGHRFIPEVHPDDSEEFQKVLDKSLVEPYDLSYEVRMMTTVGWRWFEWANRAIRKEDGSVSEIVTVGRDITDRKTAEKALKRSEETALALLNSFIDSAILLDADGKVIALNEGTAKHYSKSTEELIGKDIFRLMPNDIAEQRKARLVEAANTQKPIRFEDQRAGMWFDNVVCPIFDELGNIFRYAVYASDITAHKNAENLLRVSEARLLEAQSIGKIGSWEWDINSDKAIWSDQSYVLVGVEPNEFEPSLDTFLNFVIDEDKHIVNAALKKALKGEDSTYECRIIRKDGKERVLNIQYKTFFDHEHKPVRIAGTHEDITERKHAEDSLKLSEEKFSKAFFNSPNAITLSSLEDGKILDINDFGAKALGYKKEEIIGKTSIELSIVNNEDRNRIFDELKTNGSYSDLELTVKTKSGEERIGLFYGQPISIGNKDYLVQTITDITQIKIAEEEIQKLALIIKETDNGIIITGINEKTEWINEGFTKITGYNATDVIGKEPSEFMFDDETDEQTLNQLINAINKQISSEVELQICCKDRKRKWIQINVQPVFNEQNDFVRFIGIVLDINQRKLAEMTLTEQHNIMRTMIDALPLNIFVKDNDHKFILGNEALARHHNVASPDEIMGKTDFDLYPLEVAERYKALERNIMDLNEGFVDHVDAIINENGNKEWWNNTKIPLRDHKGISVGFVGIHKNITEIVKTEEELRQSEERYRTIFDSSTSGIIIMDKDLNIIDANQMACQMYDYTFDEIKSLNIRDLTSKRTYEQHTPKVAEFLCEGNSMEFEAVDVKKGGEEFSTNVSLSSINYRGENYTLDIVTDITERKLAEKALKLSEEKFSKAFRLSPDIISISSQNEGKMWEINDSVTRILGYDRAEVIGKSTTEFNLWVNPEERQKSLEILLSKKRLVNFETTFRAKNGEIKSFLLGAQFINISGENHILTNARDITQLKAATEALIISEEKFSKAFYNSPNGISITLIEGGKILDINDYASEQLGYNKEEIIGKTAIELGIMKEEDMSLLLEELQRNGSYSDIELKVKTKLGDERIGLFYGQQIMVGNQACLFQTITDITKVRKAEEELVESEERYKTIYKSTSNSFVIFDLDLNIIDANPAACEMYGYSLDEMKSLNLRQLKTSEMISKHLPTLEGLLRDNSWKKFESLDIKKNGDIFWTEVRLHIFYLHGKKYFLDIATDVTDRKKAEEALKLSEEKFSKAFLASPDSVTLSSVADGKLIELNRGFEKIFGYTIDEAKGKTTVELELYKNPVDRDNVINILKSEGSVRDYEAEYNAKDGKRGIAEISMELIHIGEENFLLTIVRDITERKRFEEELSESEEKFSGAFHSSMDGYAISRFSDGVIVEINEVFIKMFEGNREEIIGKTTLELGLYKYKKDRERVIEELNKNDAVENMEAEYVTKNNNIGWAQFSINKIKISGDQYLFTSIRDITEQKRVQTEIEEYQEDLKSLASELTLAEEKERRRIAVNLHDHLSQSLAMSKIRLAEAEKAKLGTNTLEKIRDAKNFLDTAINNSRTITYDLSPPVLYDLGFSAAVRWRLDQVEKDHKIKTELVDNAETMILKNEVRVLLYRASIEIINNSIKHSKATKLTIVIDKDIEYLYVRITDNGIGFDPGVAEKEATKKRSFGLFSIRERISFLHGKMEIDSIIGNGTTIKIRIPYDLTI